LKKRCASGTTEVVPGYKTGDAGKGGIAGWILLRPEMNPPGARPVGVPVIPVVPS
jgi:hypothetical protein